MPIEINDRCMWVMILMVVHIGEAMKAISNVREVKCKECLPMLTSLVLQINEFLKGIPWKILTKSLSDSIVNYSISPSRTMFGQL